MERICNNYEKHFFWKIDKEGKFKEPGMEKDIMMYPPLFVKVVNNALYLFCFKKCEDSFDEKNISHVIDKLGNDIKK